MDDSASNPLQKISKVIETETVSGKQAAEFLEQAIEYFFTLGVELTDETKMVLTSFVPVMERLVLMTASDVPDCFHYQAVLAFIKGNFVLYYKKLESYFQVNNIPFDWIQAEKRFFRIILFMPTLAVEKVPSSEQLFGILLDYASKYYLGSAFEIYCKYRCSGKDAQENLKLLQKVINKDCGWALAWIDEGDIYQEQKKWIQSLAAYKKALEILEREKNNDYGEYLFFKIAYISDKLKDLDSAMFYYKKCMEINSIYTCAAQNNLAYCLMKQKRFEEAEPYLRFAVAHDEDNRCACRNLFRVLEKLDRSDDLIALVKQYPEHFNTKG